MYTISISKYLLEPIIVFILAHIVSKLFPGDLLFTAFTQHWSTYCEFAVHIVQSLDFCDQYFDYGILHVLFF